MAKCYLSDHPNIYTPTIPSHKRVLLPGLPALQTKAKRPPDISLLDDRIERLIAKPDICVEGAPLRTAAVPPHTRNQDNRPIYEVEYEQNSPVETFRASGLL